jgi:hypothetical protein
MYPAKLTHDIRSTLSVSCQVYYKDRELIARSHLKSPLRCGPAFRARTLQEPGVERVKPSDVVGALQMRRPHFILNPATSHIALSHFDVLALKGLSLNFEKTLAHAARRNKLADTQSGSNFRVRQ